MRKLLIIARSNMRNAKGQTVAIISLILLAAMLLNLWLMLSMDYKANFLRYHDKLNAEHVTLAVDDADGTVYGFLTETLAKDTAVKEYRMDRCMYMVGKRRYPAQSEKPKLLRKANLRAEYICLCCISRTITP